MKVFLSVVVLCAVAQCEPITTVSPETVGLSSAQLARIDSVFQDLINDGQVSGVSILISRQGQVAYRKNLGFMDLEAHRAMATDALFRIASMTKAVTAVAVLQLFEQGHFMLDDPAAQWIPVLKNMRVMDPNQEGADSKTPRTVPLSRDMTIRDLLRHTSGIYGGARYTRAGLREWSGTLKGFVERLASVPLQCQPGTQFLYSYSTDVLGYLVEVVSGFALDQYCERHIFAPLGLSDTGFVVPPDKVLRLTHHYDFKNGKLVCSDKADHSPFLKRAQALSGGGGWNYSYPGLVTTVKDWWRFLEMLRLGGQLDNVRLLSPSAVKLMCTDHLGDMPGAFEPGTGHGLGVGVVTDTLKHGQLAGNGTIFWAGGPHNTYYFVDFKEQMCGILFIQSGPFGHQDMMQRFLVLAHQAIEN